MTRNFSLNGRHAAIFFLWLIGCVASAQQVALTQDVMVNRGLLDESFWRNQALQSSARRVIAYTDVGVHAEWPIMGQALIYERKTINTLLSNSNTLAMVSRDGAYSSMMGNGALELQAQTKRYKFDALGAKLSTSSLDESLHWFVSPKWVRLLDMREAEGVGNFSKDDTSLSLQGDLQRAGLTSYGFQTDSTPPSLLSGGALDVGFAFESVTWRLNGSAQHLYSKIPAHALYFSNRTYNVNATTAQGIVYSSVPSLSGTYGQQDKSLSLPKIVKAEGAYKSGFAGAWLKAGLVGVDGRYVTWLGAMFPVGGHELEIRNYELNNLQFTYRTPAVLKGHLSGEVMLIRDVTGSHKSLVSGLRLSF